MNQRRVLLSNALAGMIDQALLSALNFAIGLLFIRLASKEEYGLYTQFFGLLMLSQSLQNALTNSPLIALGAKLSDARMRTLSEHLLRLQTWVSLVLGAVSIVGVWLTDQFAHVPQLEMSVALGFVCALVGQWLREFARHYHFLNMRPHAALLTDILYGASLVCGLVITVLWLEVTTTWLLLVMGIASAIAGLHGILQSKISLGRASADARNLMQRAWSMSRWTLPGTIVDWLSRNTFAIVVGAILGLAAAADISAARLLLMPAALCVTAWGKVFTPRFSRWWGAGDTRLLDTVSRVSVIALVAIMAAYTAVLVLGFDLLQRFVLGGEYATAKPLLLTWAIYFAITAIRQVGTVTMAAGERFQSLFHYGWIATLIGLPAAIVLTWLAGTQGAIFGLILGESALALLILLRGVRSMRANRSQHRETGAPSA